MAPPNTGLPPQDVFGGASNRHRHIEARLLGETALAGCLACKRPFTADDKDARANAEAFERERAETEQRQRHQFEEKYRQQYEQKHKMLQAEAHTKGIAAGKTQMQEQLDRLAADKRAAVAEKNGLVEKLLETQERAERLEADKEAAINQQVERSVAAYCAKKDAEYALRESKHFLEIQAAKTKADQLQRLLDSKNAQQEGKEAEVVMTRDLKAAFPGDVIDRIRPGQSGADTRQIVRDKGNEIASILHERKEVRLWRDDYATKLRHDQLKDGAAYAVCWTSAMPRDSGQLTQRDNVIITTPAHGVTVTTILREFLIKLDKLNVDAAERDEKTAAFFASFTSGQGHELLVTAHDVIDKRRRLDTTERKQHNKIWKDREQLDRSQDQIFREIFALIDGIAADGAP
jgi:hypothetical protein